MRWIGDAELFRDAGLRLPIHGLGSAPELGHALHGAIEQVAEKSQGFTFQDLPIQCPSGSMC